MALAALAHFETASFEIPTAFDPTDKGMKQALDASAQATIALEELQLAIASKRLADLFKQQPGLSIIEAFEDTNGDDEGRSWVETNVICEFSDGTKSNDWDHDMNDFIEGNDSTRQEVFDEVESEIFDIFESMPLTRKAIFSATITAKTAAALAGDAFQARQEAFQISRVAKKPSAKAKKAPSI